jgi:hypothetical protein
MSRETHGSATPATGAHQATGVPAMGRSSVLALLGGACAALLVALAAAPAAEGAPAPAAVAVTAARTAPDARSFTVRLNTRANQVVVCDVNPFWCAPASRSGRLRWTAVLPTGPLPASGPSDATDLHGPPQGRIAGASATFDVAVIAISRTGTVRRRSFRGTYGSAAAAARPAAPLG